MPLPEQNERGVIITVKAHAGARKNAVLGRRNDALRIAVTAAPEKGKANRAIIELLAQSLGVSKSAIELIAGETSPQKRFLIKGANVHSIADAIAAAT